MSSTKPAPKRHPAAYKAELRLRYFWIFTIAALRDYSIFFILVGTLWLWIRAVPTTIPMPFPVLWIRAVPTTIPMPFPMRWVCIVILWLETGKKCALLLEFIVALANHHISKIEDENRSRDHDLATRPTNLEDRILAKFCVIAGLSSIGLTGAYWIGVLRLVAQFSMRIITHGFWISFCWTLIMGCLLSLFWFFIWTIRRYRKAKGIEQNETWRFLFAVIVIQMRNIFQGPRGDRVLSQVLEVSYGVYQALTFLPKLLLWDTGFYIGRGPLFDRLPDGWKAERRNCKTPEDIHKFLASIISVFGRWEDDKEEEPQDREEAFFHPSVFEQEPNPVIFAHLRDEPRHSLDSSHFEAKDLMDTAEANRRLIPEADARLEDMTGLKNDQKTPFQPSHNGPTTRSVNLSSFQCSECFYVAKKRAKLNKHIKQKHDRPYECAHHGCGQKFGLRTHLERHQATHTGKKEFECANAWCQTQCTREDNLKRHIKGCVAST